MKFITVFIVSMISLTSFAQSKKELKSENQNLKESIRKLQDENNSLKNNALTQDLLVGSSFGTITESDLIITDGMYMDRKDVDPNSKVYKNSFYNRVSSDEEYRGRILATFGFSKKARILAISLKDCVANDYSQFINSDAVRSITCKAALIAQEQNEKLIVDNSKRSQVKDYTAGFSTKNSAQINNGKSITKD